MAFPKKTKTLPTWKLIIAMSTPRGEFCERCEQKPKTIALVRCFKTATLKFWCLNCCYDLRKEQQS